MSAPARVVLVHGLWYGRPSMWPLAQRLKGNGWCCDPFGYTSVHRSPAGNVARLEKFVRAIDAATVHLVGHSLGGLLILKILERSGGDLPPGRVVLIGTPVGGSAVARRMSGSTLLRPAIGRSAELLEPGIERLPADREIAMIAGSASFGAGQLVAHLDKPNDGTVAVAETRISGLADHLELPVSHTGLVLSGRVARAVDRFLHTGRFGR